MLGTPKKPNFDKIILAMKGCHILDGTGEYPMIN